ncbi:putative D,D-dipeptide transport system permease protein DdpB [subsurface metagenome]|jgi:peptide/nickel transport system permease protein
MLYFITKRSLLGILTLFGVILITFVLVRLVPSDPAAQWVGGRATPTQIEAAREELGLDKPIHIQFGYYIRDLLKGNLGYSLKTHQPISKELKDRFPATFELVVISFIIALLIGIPLGLISAKNKDSWIDHFSRFFSIGAISIPTFWLALVLQLIFFMFLGLLPSGGQLSMKIKLFQSVPHITGFVSLDCLITGNFAILKDFLKHLILPAICVGAYAIGLVARMTRSALLEILSEDYIKAARSYGLSERLILYSYALKNSLGPTITVVTLSMGYTFTNTFLAESVFSWPGIGRYVAEAVMCLDYPAIMGVTIVAACAYVLLNLIADIIISFDPRVKL